MQTFSELVVGPGTSLSFPEGFSFFEPYLPYFIKQITELGGEARVSRTSTGEISGVFVYDTLEKAGTIFTRSREVFDHYYKLKPFDSLFAELKINEQCETYDIYTVDVAKLSEAHRFRYEIAVADREQMNQIEHFMISTHHGINKAWVRVAFESGEKCFIVWLGSQIAGLAWVSVVNRIGRLHSLFVNPQFRGIGIGRDLLYARLLWLRAKHARSAFSEISRDNHPSSKIAVEGGMTASGQVYQYFREDSASRTIERE